MLCEGFCVNWKATLGSTVKPVEGGRVEERQLDEGNEMGVGF